MYANNLRIRLERMAGAAIFLASMAACAATPESGTREQGPSPAAGPSASNESFRQLRAQCETSVPSGKASGDICVDAAAMLVGSELPDEFREMNEEQRVKIALRLLERGVDSSNLARARAYDWYNKVSFFGLSAYADAYRARELMDMMMKSGYPGAILRKIRSSTGILSFGSTEAEKRDDCAAAKKLLGAGKLDVDSIKIAKEVVESGVCVGFEPKK